jgi:hypothetical protein
MMAWALESAPAIEMSSHGGSQSGVWYGQVRGQLTLAGGIEGRPDSILGSTWLWDSVLE